jgi:glucokinase
MSVNLPPSAANREARTLSVQGAFAGIDVGGTKIAAAIGTARGEILASARIDTRSAKDRTPADTLRRVADLIRQLETETLAIEAIGIGLPGLVDASGLAQFLPNLPGQWRGVRVTDTLTKLTGHPTYAVNDARMATLGEFVFGAGRQTQRMLLLTLGTGIGGGLVLDGQLQLGVCGGAGEIGHQTIIPDGPLCTCGNRGCLETLSGGPALTASALKLIESGDAEELRRFANDGSLSVHHIVTAADQGNAACAALIARAAEFIGIGIANAVTLTAVDTVILTGGLTALGERLLKPIRETLANRVRMFPTHGIEITISGLGERAALLGAIALASGHAAAPAPTRATLKAPATT